MHRIFCISKHALFLGHIWSETPENIVTIGKISSARVDQQCNCKLDLEIILDDLRRWRGEISLVQNIRDRDLWGPGTPMPFCMAHDEDGDDDLIV